MTKTTGRNISSKLTPCLQSSNRVFGPSLRAISTCAAVAGALFAMGVAPASAQSLQFDRTPVTDAVAQIDSTFNANIVIGPGVSLDKSVTFDVSDIDGVGARLDAINSLANAINADFEKVFVISKLADGAKATAPSIDATDAPVVFADGSIPAAEAIRLVAGVDGATTQFYSTIHGTVIMPDRQTTAAEAATDLARDTHTVWKAIYILSPRRGGHSTFGDVVLGHTASGRPIVELPGDTFRAARDLEPPVEDLPASTGSATAASNASTASAAAAAGQNGGATQDAGANGANAGQQNTNGANTGPYVIGGNQPNNSSGAYQNNSGQLYGNGLPPYTLGYQQSPASIYDSSGYNGYIPGVGSTDYGFVPGVNPYANLGAQSNVAPGITNGPVSSPYGSSVPYGYQSNNGSFTVLPQNTGGSTYGSPLVF